MAQQYAIVKYATNAVQRHLHYTAARSFLCGIGLAYAISNEKYAHVPLIVLMPSVYTGYQAYVNRDTIRDWVRGVKKTA